MISKIFVTTIILTLLSFHANALTCERKKYPTQGFVSKAAAESWFPKIINFSNSDFKPKGKPSKQMIYTIGQFTYNLLPNGKLIVKISGGNTFVPIPPAYYKCDLNAIELRELVEKNPSPQKTEGKSNTSPNSKRSVSETPSKDIEKAEKKCSEIGYTPATEKYADCGMKLMN